ncbi:type I restriction endonuclease subunit R [Aquisalimonas asiatica]|uniref:Type I restriction enzyme, R subunit n=1 Tax=Aquisalimonas asiatica TaxID=406100 RepID=A0A1H8VVU7_9GAMM|nr:DEAD/DEAH box helicase family protein [Aquisalimonas asiatica]SEP19526.1 type I restriction enzyme, R subunit [Aquisalimonas asiatica]
MADEREHQFQKDIIQEMTAQGWQTGKADGYDRELALYTRDLVDFFKEAYPDRWEKFTKAYPGEPERQLCMAVDRQRRKKGTLFVLRNPVRLPGHYIEACAFKPDHGMNPESEQRYQANRLRVVPEVSYSPHAGENYNPRLDLVLFVNGIPTATLELKSEFKQSVERAKRQYQHDRPLKAPTNKQVEPLLAFKTGALVHFAVSQDRVAMTTRLAGERTRFLPFDRGTREGGAGNSTPTDPNDYATGYLWNEVFAPDAWLRILQRFLHLERKEEEDFHGNITTKENLIFPRYHQWEVVNRLIETTREEGAGARYLIQHSAGSGKSNSIAWTAHQLAGLYDAHDAKLFNSVIVITDRTVLDSQLQNTIRQFERTEGMVRAITRDEKTSQSKSEQLAEALRKGTRIIVVTIQTFPALYDALEKDKALAQGRYAVIADEAHSSQTGASATKLKALLGGGEGEEDEDEVSAEDVLDAAVSSRKPPTQLSYYAFTATPKGKTLELFGRPPNPNEPKGEDNLPEPFHLYSMRQAIEEGFILDVLKNYVTYSVAWRLAHPHGDEEEVESRKASATLARWVRLHPHNINQKVEVIVEHFRANLRHLLDGQAKAMVVTASRQEAVRYMLAMRQYVQQQGYEDVHPLVAFSGEVPADGVIPEAVTETSKLLNPGLHGRKLADAFDTDDYNVMLVANKFQTGFDQPKLCAMYVDKKLKGVECVQTLSRLNRVFPGKETFILDFVNDAADVQAAFEPYYQQTELANVSDAQVVYDLFDKLNEAGIYTWSEVEEFARTFFDPKAKSARLTNACQPAKDRFKARYNDAQKQMQEAQRQALEAERKGDERGRKRAEHDLKQAGEQRDTLDTFRKDLQSFVRAYEFLSQIVFYDDRDLEQLCVFARSLHPLLRIERLDDEIDVSELELTHYRLTKQAENRLELGEAPGEYTLKPVSDVGSGKAHDPETRRLSEIIESLNEIFGSDIREDDQLHYAKGLAGRLEREESVMTQVLNNDPNQIMRGSLFSQRLQDLVLDDMNEHRDMAEKAMETRENELKLAHLVLRLLLDKHQRPGGVVARNSLL